MARKKLKKGYSYPIGPIEGDVLQQLSAGDLLMSFLLSAGSTRLLYKEAYQRARARQGYQRAIKSLSKKGYVRFAGETIHLTKSGEALLSAIAAPDSVTEKGWDGTWWLLLYDIPSSLNEYRFKLRNILRRTGFRKLQLSVWIHPMESKELSLFLKENPKLASAIRHLNIPTFQGMKTLTDWRKLPTT